MFTLSCQSDLQVSAAIVPTSKTTFSSWAPPEDTLDLAAKQKCKFYKYNNINQYDTYFKKYSKQYLHINFDYLYIKSQAIAESNLNPNALSPVGAQGILQIMPNTYKDIVRKNPEIKGTAREVKWNIQAGVYYMSEIWNKWKKKQTWLDHWNFSTSSYNAGMGNIIKAQKLSKEQNLNTEIWDSIEKTLPSITKHHSNETIGYVHRIILIRSCLIG